MTKIILVPACFVCILFSSFSAFAQKDYVITNKGDTVRCKISAPFFGIGVIKYKANKAADYVKIDPKEIKEYRRGDDEIMESVLTGHKDKPQFMNLLERGKISIYYDAISTTYYNGIGGYGSRTTKFWYCGKQGTDTIMSLKTDGLYMDKSKKSRKEDFGTMLKDNPAVYNKYIADDKFSFGQLRKLIHLYNTGEELTNEKYRGY